jgi:hypothetical protein
LSAGQPLHEQAKVLGVVTRVDYQMNMVGHQTIGVHLAPKLSFPLLECIEIIEVIVIPSKNGLAIMTSLDDMVRVIWENETGLSRHD